MSSEESLLRDYLRRFPGERSRTQPFSDFLARNDPAQRTSRANFDGHITASAFVLSGDRAGLLLVRHKSLDRWLQPGGHVESGDASLLAAAYREILEETAIPAAELTRLTDGEVPFDLDSHPIPANPRKGEPAHTHHDFRYLFVYRGRAEATRGEDGGGIAWVPLKEVAKREEFAPVVKKIRELLVQPG